MGSGETAVTMVSSLAILPLLASLSAAQLPVPGSIPGLSLDQQFAYIQQLQNHLNTQVQWSGRRKRSLPVPGTTGLVSGSAAEAQWYQQQLAQIALISSSSRNYWTCSRIRCWSPMVPTTACSNRFDCRKKEEISSSSRNYWTCSRICC